jgi:hypothetical protein
MFLASLGDSYATGANFNSPQVNQFIEEKLPAFMPAGLNS